jgi:hypothetical protein
MATALPVPLHAMVTDELAKAASVSPYPKWSTMCLLRRCGLPVLNAVLVEPDQSRLALRSAITMLTRATGATRLMVRSDGGIETKTYYRGGNTFPVAEVTHRAAPLLEAGRAVILLEPTNRFTNHLSALLRMDRVRGEAGRFTVESLGPGYDVADLTRGGLSPQVTVTIDGVDWSRYAEPWWADLSILRDLAPTAEATRRRRRLERLAAHVLTDHSQPPDSSRADAAERWLRVNGYLGLFADDDPTMAVLRRTKTWFSDAFLLAAIQPRRGWTCLATAVSVLDDGRTVYWDLVDGTHKYGARSHSVLDIRRSA